MTGIERKWVTFSVRRYSFSDSRLFAFIRGLLILLFAATTIGCSHTSPTASDTGVPDGDAHVLFDTARIIQDEWRHLRLRGETEYRVAAKDGELAIRAIGRKSASGLIRSVELDLVECPWLEWSWLVSAIPIDADIRDKAREDVAASLFLLFGDPRFLTDPEPVPTLRYVWASDHTASGSVVDSPYMPGVVRSIVVQSGSENAGKWLTERRNLVEDFELAFGHSPEDTVHALALFTDNDQTGQPVEAYYAWARASCP